MKTNKTKKITQVNAVKCNFILKYAYLCKKPQNMQTKILFLNSLCCDSNLSLIQQLFNALRKNMQMHELPGPSYNTEH